MPRDIGIDSAFLLAGGKGERLMPLTIAVQKVMLPIKGKPILEHNIELLRRFGVKRIVLGVGKHAEGVRGYFGNGSRFGVKVVYSVEGKPLGTAGALKQAENNFKRTFIMSNGDLLGDIDIAAMYKQHKKAGAKATICAIKVKDARDFGLLKMKGKKILEFKEKPKRKVGGLINSGFYILEPQVLLHIPRKRKASIEREVFPRIAAEGKLYGFVSRRQWFAIDTIEKFSKAMSEWKGFK